MKKTKSTKLAALAKTRDVLARARAMKKNPTAKRGPGAQYKFTESQMRKAVKQAFGKSGDIASVCEELDVCAQTIRNWSKKFKATK